MAWEAAGKPVVKLLCAGCRAALPERFSLNVPLPLLSLVALAQLESQAKLPAGDATVSSIPQALAADLSSTWETFRQQSAARQNGLPFDLPDELGLR